MRRARQEMAGQSAHADVNAFGEILLRPERNEESNLHLGLCHASSQRFSFAFFHYVPAVGRLLRVP